MKEGRSLSLRRLSAYAGLGLGAVVLAVALLILTLGGALLNGYGKRWMERAFAAAHPGHALQLGELAYTVGANRLVAESVALSGPASTLETGRMTLTGVRWARLLWGKAALADVLAEARLDAASLAMELPRSRYGLRCARLRASVPESELIVEGAEVRPSIDDEALFAARPFRTTRYRVVVPECRVSGVAYGELFQGRSYSARSVRVLRPSLDALANRDKPRMPPVGRKLMVHEALAAVRRRVQVDSLVITDGQVSYGERVVAGARPGVLTFAAVSMSAEGIANRGEAPAVIRLKAQGDFMRAGVLKVEMTIPVASPDLSLRYSGSLSAMDLTRLNAFSEAARHIRIESGSAAWATFEVDVTAGQARGRVRGVWSELKIALLDRQTGSEKGLRYRAASFLVNALTIRDSNAPDASGALMEGEVNYTRDPRDGFVRFVWFAVKSGVLDVISP